MSAYWNCTFIWNIASGPVMIILKRTFQMLACAVVSLHTQTHMHMVILSTAPEKMDILNYEIVLSYMNRNYICIG